MLNKSLEHTLLEYVKNNQAVIPLKADKTPTMTNWQHRKPTGQLVYAEFSGIKAAGWVISSQYVVLDLDNHGKDKVRGVESLKKLNKDIGYDLIANAAIIVKTANGGYHLYYKLPIKYQNRKLKKNLEPQYPSIDIKGKGGYVIIPNSTIFYDSDKNFAKDGLSYTSHILNTGWSNLKELPEKLCEMIMRNEAAVFQNSIEEFTNKESDIKLFEFYLSKLPDIADNERNDTLYKIACTARDYAISLDCLKTIIEDQPSDNIGQLTSYYKYNAVIEHAYTYATGSKGNTALPKTFNEPDNTITLDKKNTIIQATELIDWKEALFTTKEGIVSRNNFAQRNCEIFIKHLSHIKENFDGEPSKNIFTQDVFIGKHKVNEDVCLRIKSILNDQGFDPNLLDIRNAIGSLALYRSFHPIRQWFKELTPWDKKPRLKSFFSQYCSAKQTEFTAEVGTKMFVAAVSRIMEPGINFERIITLIGGQGIGKTTLIKTLAIKACWYSDSLGDITSKDIIYTLKGVWWFEIAELSSTYKKENQVKKAFFSRQIDSGRPAYGRDKIEYPRQCIFIGTTNEDSFLGDETGDRRSWPVRVGKIKLNELKKDLDQLYAESLYLYNQHTLDINNLTEKSEDIAKELQKEHYQSDVLEEVIGEWLDKEDKCKTTILEIWRQCLTGFSDNIPTKEQKRIKVVMKHIGWSYGSIRFNNKVTKGFKKNVDT